MPVWEYHQIDLNDLPPKTEEVDVLNELDAEGWELVGTIMSRTSSVAETTVSGAPRRRQRGFCGQLLTDVHAGPARVLQDRTLAAALGDRAEPRSISLDASGPRPHSPQN
jgi:hypothetical protein